MVNITGIVALDLCCYALHHLLQGIVVELELVVAQIIHWPVPPEPCPPSQRNGGPPLGLLPLESPQGFQVKLLGLAERLNIRAGELDLAGAPLPQVALEDRVGLGVPEAERLPSLGEGQDRDFRPAKYAELRRLLEEPSAALGEGDPPLFHVLPPPDLDPLPSPARFRRGSCGCTSHRTMNVGSNKNKHGRKIACSKVNPRTPYKCRQVLSSSRGNIITLQSRKLSRYLSKSHRRDEHSRADKFFDWYIYIYTAACLDLTNISFPFKDYGQPGGSPVRICCSILQIFLGSSYF